MSSPVSNVAIIGAGLGGCAIALALASQEIPVTVYEYRREDAEVLKSGVILTPNGLRVLDLLGVFDRIKDRCWVSTHRCYKNDADQTLRRTMISHDTLYGYSNHRLWRKILLDELRTMLREHNVPIHYSSRFTGIVTETAKTVTFTINSETVTASLLIASDGLHSSVRPYLDSNIEPEYTGIIGIISHIRRDAIAWPSPDYDRNATIQGGPGAIFFIPEDPDAKDIMIGLQVRHPGLSRADLDALQHDHDALVGFYNRDYDSWGSTAKKIIDEVVKQKHTAYAWPFMRMPKLERWFSGTGRVILMGDGAHALPPSSGQGVNQALEDAYSLMLLLREVNAGKSGLPDALKFWQTMRQERIDAVFDWATNSTNVERMPEAERQRLTEEGKYRAAQADKQDDMSWLYRPRLEEDVAGWISSIV